MYLMNPNGVRHLCALVKTSQFYASDLDYTVSESV
jgi:hypothetical protein